MSKKIKKCSSGFSPEYIMPVVYWGTAASLIILKAVGISSLTWFWSTIMVLWPFYLAGIIITIMLFCVVIVFFGAIVVGIIEGLLDVYDNYRIKKQREERKRKNNE